MKPNRDRKKVWWAVFASLLLHLLVGLSLAAFGGGLQKPAPEDSGPPELTLMELPPEETPPPLAPKNAPTTVVDPAQASAVAPNEKTFEANENSIAAAEKAATEQNVLPGQDGKDRPFANLEEHEQSFAREGAAPAPTPEATATPRTEPTPTESAPPVATPTPAADELALLTQTPTPLPSPPPTEENTEAPTPAETPTPEPSASSPVPASSYRDFQQKTMIRGGISNRGRSAVNAIGTPLGRYKKMLEDAIGSRWYYYVGVHPDLANIGTTVVTFEITADGSARNLRMTENTTTEVSASIALRSIQETKFPPIPEDLLNTLPDGHLKMEESFTIFANR